MSDTNKALADAIDALEQIALAGMSGSGQESQEGMRDWHARRAFEFIGIAARALEPARAALAAQEPERAEAVYLVVTGETHNGQETYTRHEGSPPPLCEYERLWSNPPAVQDLAEPWCPDVCTITGLPFFMWIEHHKTGRKVPTYGGPYDSYTIPVFDGESYCRERYDHDRGGWLTDEVQDLDIQIVSAQAYVSDKPPAAQPVAPVLVRDAAEVLGATVPDVCTALEKLGGARRSTNMAISGEELLAVAAELKKAAQPVEMSPEFTDSARAALLWVLWHHQGGSSPVGQPIRYALGLGAHEPLTSRHAEKAKKWAAQAGATTAEFHAATAAQPVAVPADERRQLQHLLADIVETVDQDGLTIYRVRSGAALIFSNFVAACARLLATTPAPAQAQQMTEGQIDALLLSHGRGDDGFHDFARAIERTCAESWGVELGQPGEGSAA